MTDRVARRLRRDFGAKSERLAREMGEVVRTEREHAALLLLAEGDETRLHQAMDLARLDRRDLLRAAGLDKRNWARRLDHELGRTSRRTGGSPSRRWPKGCLLTVLVAPGVLFFFVGVPLLIIDDYRDATGRDEATAGVVLENRGGWSKGGRRHVCTYDYVVEGVTRTGTADCSEDDRAGDEVTVRYDPTDPASSDLGGNDRVALVVGLGASAFCLVVVAVQVVRARRRRT